MTVEYENLGTMPYDECLRYQRQLFDRRLNMRGGDAGDPCGRILFVEHPPVYTLGKSGRESNLLVSGERLQAAGAALYRTDRGGDVTFHGAGQTVCYPILDLAVLGLGLRDYIAALEECVIDTVAEYGIAAGRFAGATGVWICDTDGEGREGAGEGCAGAEATATGACRQRNWRKICAIGVRASRFVTMHGFALNVSTDLRWFAMINPCGITDKGVTSMEREAGRRIDSAEVEARLLANLCRQLGIDGVKNVGRGNGGRQ